MSSFAGSIGTGLLAARPASGVIGALYFATDTRLCYRWSGSAWATWSAAVMVGDSGAGGTLGLVPAPAAGDAAAGKFLKADGTWAVGAGGGAAIGIFAFTAGASHNPADSTTYTVGLLPNVNPPSTGSESNPIMPRAGTVKKAYVRVRVFGTLASAQTVTVSVRNKTAATSEAITSSMQFSSATNLANNTGLSLAFSAGDELETTFLTPAWTTNPTSVFYQVTVEVEFS